MPENDSTIRMLHPKHWKKAVGYSNGTVAEGRTVFLGGQIGWNADQLFEDTDFVHQIDQALENIVTLLAEAGAKAHHLVRLTWYVTDKREYLARLAEIGAVYRARLGRHYPAMTMVQVVALIEDEAKVEIEATAVVPR